MARRPGGKSSLVMIGTLVLAVGALSSAALAQTDPGVRGGAAGVGGPLSGLSGTETLLWQAGFSVFQEVDSVPSGLGPRFNLTSCFGCHSQPTTGGASGAFNPQTTVATEAGASNVIPSFITANGPVREARFVNKPDGTPDGGVHALFTISGRGDASGCTLAQPNFAAAVAANNVIFRVPTAVFGLGLVEATRDSELVAASASLASAQTALGITSGFFNHSGNDGTITRFGWKAQNKSLLMFAGEAYNVEQGVTNELFPTERDETPGCTINATPEDFTDAVVGGGSGSAAANAASDIVNFADFMRLSAAPQPAAATASTTQGLTQFVNIGCASCHFQQHISGRSVFAALSGNTYAPFSDFALHNMGSGLQDRVSQGNASGTQFRTAPLWGIGQRIFFLHDGRTKDLLAAIAAHSSTGSEANTVINNFNLLSAASKQNILNFLRSL
jgi:CxxC motif-containing protein (DUF1111 family)